MYTEPIVPRFDLHSEDSTNDTDSESATQPNLQALKPKPGRAVATVFPNNAQPSASSGDANTGVETPTEEGVGVLPDLSEDFDVPVSAFEVEGFEERAEVTV